MSGLSVRRASDVEVVGPSVFGGGWVIPLTPAGTQALMEFFDEEPAPLMPLGERAGYIVEPWQTADLAEHLRSCNIAWKVN